MSCPTCDRPIDINIGFNINEKVSVFYCPRCGTIRFGDADNFCVPQLVERARALADSCVKDGEDPVLNAVQECVTKDDQEKQHGDHDHEENQ